MSYQSWTFEPLEIHQENTWDICDPNTAELVATFHDYEEAVAFLKWRNKKQAKRKLRKQQRLQAYNGLAEKLRGSWG